MPTQSGDSTSRPRFKPQQQSLVQGFLLEVLRRDQAYAGGEQTNSNRRALGVLWRRRANRPGFRWCFPIPARLTRSGAPLSQSGLGRRPLSVPPLWDHRGQMGLRMVYAMLGASDRSHYLTLYKSTEAARLGRPLPSATLTEPGFSVTLDSNRSDSYAPSDSTRWQRCKRRRCRMQTPPRQCTFRHSTLCIGPQRHPVRCNVGAAFPSSIQRRCNRGKSSHTRPKSPVFRPGGGRNW